MPTWASTRGPTSGEISRWTRTSRVPEVLFSNVAAQVMSWTDTEIVVRVPHRHLYGVGKRNEFVS